MTHTIDHESEEWTQARKRIIDRRDFGTHLLVYAVVNGMLIAIWAATGAGYFWPAWFLGCWAIGIVLHGWDVFVKRSITDADIEAELHRTQR
jgi:hypothetical protein